jgi:hypothetical protein
LTDDAAGHTIGHTMTNQGSYPARLLAEALAPYGADDPRGAHTKLSISLPSDLFELVKAAAETSGQSVSGTIAASLRRTLQDAEQARLDAALTIQDEEGRQLAEAYTPIAAKLWSNLEW